MFIALATVLLRTFIEGYNLLDVIHLAFLTSVWLLATLTSLKIELFSISQNRVPDNALMGEYTRILNIS